MNFRGPKLIILSRFPVPGKAKTRLIPALGPTRAAELQRRMTSYTVETARSARRKIEIGIELRTEGASDSDFKGWLGNDIEFQAQGVGDLGQRIARAITESFNDGFKPAIVVGADCPWLTTDHLERAIELLSHHDMVMGPTEDGGYYLIGLNTHCEQLFTGIPWGGHQVFDKSIEQAEALGLTVGMLETLSDVDRPEDLTNLPDEFKVD